MVTFAKFFKSEEAQLLLGRESKGEENNEPQTDAGTETDPFSPLSTGTVTLSIQSS